MLVDGVNAVEPSVVVVINDDVLVLILPAQLCDHGLSECRRGGVFLGIELTDVDEFLNALLDDGGEADSYREMGKISPE
jgi:hypothetical protein